MSPPITTSPHHHPPLHNIPLPPLNNAQHRQTSSHHRLIPLIPPNPAPANLAVTLWGLWVWWSPGPLVWEPWRYPGFEWPRSRSKRWYWTTRLCYVIGMGIRAKCTIMEVERAKDKSVKYNTEKDKRVKDKWLKDKT